MKDRIAIAINNSQGFVFSTKGICVKKYRNKLVIRLILSKGHKYVQVPLNN